MKISMADSQKLKLVLSYDFAVPLLEIFLKVYIPLHTEETSATLLQWQKLESGIKFMNLCINVRNVVHVHNKVLEP